MNGNKQKAMTNSGTTLTDPIIKIKSVGKANIPGDNCDLWFEHFNKFLNEYEHIADYVEGGEFEDYALRCHAYPKC